MSDQLPNTRLLDWKTMVQKQWGKQWNETEVVYRFSNGREFKDSGSRGGPYTGTSTS